MTKGQRLRYLRKELLKLSSDKFAKPLNVSGHQITMIERDATNLSERLALDICDTYNVDFYWLTEGAEMPIFIERLDTIDEFANELKLTDIEKEMIRYYLNHPSLRDEIKKALLELKEGKEI